MLKNSYKGLIIYIFAFISGMLMLCFFPVKSEALLTRLTLIYMPIGISALAYIIYKTEYIYWYNGISYEDACKATKMQRKRFAYKHLMIFVSFTIIYSIFSLVLHLLSLTYWIDIAVSVIGMITSAFMTMPIKLEE